MNSLTPEEEFFDRLGREEDDAGSPAQAPSALKSRLYSALVSKQQQSGPLLSLPKTKAAGQGLCVFEELVRITPVGEKARSFNCCSVCHARVLAENVEDAPIYWGNCPYVAFHRGGAS